MPCPRRASKAIQMPARVLKPGSPAAICEGCSCDPLVNRHGQGLPQPNRASIFFPDPNCSLHGLRATRDALISGAREIVSTAAEGADGLNERCGFCGGPIDLEEFKCFGWDSVEASPICAQCYVHEFLESGGPRRV
jgi:hypothetical protein